jgi:hypothetical protein
VNNIIAIKNPIQNNKHAAKIANNKILNTNRLNNILNNFEIMQLILNPVVIESY